jgi:subtilase family serine protease
VSDSLTLEHIYLQMNRSPAQDQAAAKLIEELHDRNSSQYHQWLSADDVAARFGPAPDDVTIVTNWLGSHGFTVHNVYTANGVIDFAGSAGAIQEAFHTEIHNLSVNGQAHIANVTDPQIPAALAPAIRGIVSLHDFRPHPALRPRANYNPGNPFNQLLVPGDLQTIYNMTPLYGRKISGQGQTIAVVEDTDLYSADDWKIFRSTFGLDKQFPQGSLRQINPQPSNNPNNGGACADPGTNGDDFEAIIDAEWASAAAPSATIVVAACADTNSNFGGFIAMQNLLTGRERPPGIISISYGTSESFLGTGNAYISSLYQLAVFQGVSVFVAAGDSGADQSDDNEGVAIRGISASGFASTPYNVAVGGTDFDDTATGTNSTYWAAQNRANLSSALSYIPEIPWNDTCASGIRSRFTAGIGQYARWRARSARCISVRGQWLLGALLCLLFFRSEFRRRTLQRQRRNPSRLGRLRRHLVLNADYGRHPGVGESGLRVVPRQPELHLLRVSGARIRLARQIGLQLIARQRDRRGLCLQ